MSDVVETLVDVAGLTISFRHEDGWMKILQNVSFTIRRGEAFGLVGESGSGKSTVALHLLGYRHASSRLESGKVLFQGRDVLAMPQRALDRLRGNHIGYVPQNSTTALNPGMRVGDHIIETLLRHGQTKSHAEASAKTFELFHMVGLPTPPQMARRYPHELSGGQQQRVCIAMALACNPELLVLDEPTTGLDVTTQKQIVDLLAKFRRQLRMSFLYVTHDLGLLAQIADRAGVMYAGQLAEVAPIADLFRQPRHPYTRGLIASIPEIDQSARPAHPPLRGMLRRSELTAGCPFQPRCDHAVASCATSAQVLVRVANDHDVACQRWHELQPPKLVAAAARTGPGVPARHTALLKLERVSLSYRRSDGLLALMRGVRRTPIVSELDLEIAAGECLGLVGESGSGKSTIAKAIAGLIGPEVGQISYKGNELAPLVRHRLLDQRREIQYIFQNPDASLNPRMTIAKILSRPLRVFDRADTAGIRQRIRQMLTEVRLDADYADRYPDQLSGGERQRIALGRALISKPVLLLCDEILSSLDVSVQSSILDLLGQLRTKHGIAMLFISHDLAVVRQIVDRVAVLYRGRVVEQGPAGDVFAPPYHPYTHMLMDAVPRLGAKIKPQEPAKLQADIEGKGQGCVFVSRCPWQLGRQCAEVPPPWRPGASGHAIRCHLQAEDLRGLTAPAATKWSDEPKPRPRPGDAELGSVAAAHALAGDQADERTTVKQ